MNLFSPQGVMSCPCCHTPLRATAIYCDACQAEKHFGPLPAENFRFSLGGGIIAPIAAFLIFPLSWWFIPITLAGAALGFALAHYRYNIDRWIRPKTSR